MNKLEIYREEDVENSVNYIWIILSIFVPFVLYYVMYKISKSVDDHVRHKVELYKDGNISSNLLEVLDNFPNNTLKYYWLFLLSGFFEFFMGLIFPINLQTLYVPMPLIFALLVNFFFFVVLVDVISKRFYAHQFVEDEINKTIDSKVSVCTFKKRSGLTFMVFTILTLTIYVYVYIWMITREYISHIQTDYMVMEEMK